MSCKIHAATQENFVAMAEVLTQGGLVALPTETVYGLAAQATNESAVRMIFHVKGRPLIDPLIVHVLDNSMAQGIAEWNDDAQACAEAFWPGPLTMILPKKDSVPDLITAGLDTVAVRSPHHEVFRSILQGCGFPLAAPSANPFGYISPSTAEHVFSMLNDRLEHIIDGGQCQHGVESTILDLSSEQPIILRPGPIVASQLEPKLGKKVLQRSSFHNEKNATSQKAAGQMMRHYSPRTSARLFQELPLKISQTACVFLQRPNTDIINQITAQNGDVFWLSESGQSEEMMRHLYSMLHKLDKMNFRYLYFQMPDEKESSAALLDRLKRACAN